MGILTRIREAFTQREIPKRIITLGADGFVVTREQKEVLRVRWSEVRELVTFKEDLFSYDAICLGFRVDDRDLFFGVGEEDVGFDLLRLEVERRFPGLPDDWFRKVMVPAFQTNWTSLWKREEGNQKTAQPGATDNPDDAQRLRKDH